VNWLSGTPKEIIERSDWTVLLLYRHGDVSVPRLDGLPIGGFIVTFAAEHSDVCAPNATIGHAHVPQITHIEPLYRIREDPAWRSIQG